MDEREKRRLENQILFGERYGIKSGKMKDFDRELTGIVGRAIQIKAAHKSLSHNHPDNLYRAQIIEREVYIRGSFIGPESRYQELLKAEQILNELTDIRFHFNLEE